MPEASSGPRSARNESLPTARTLQVLQIDAILLFWGDLSAAQGTFHYQSCANLLQIELATAGHCWWHFWWQLVMHFSAISCANLRLVPCVIPHVFIYLHHRAFRRVELSRT